MEWLKVDRRGFRHWYESCDCRSSDDKPFVDFLYRVTDEIVFHLLPTALCIGIFIIEEFSLLRSGNPDR